MNNACVSNDGIQETPEIPAEGETFDDVDLSANSFQEQDELPASDDSLEEPEGPIDVDDINEAEPDMPEVPEDIPETADSLKEEPEGLIDVIDVDEMIEKEMEPEIDVDEMINKKGEPDIAEVPENIPEMADAEEAVIEEEIIQAGMSNFMVILKDIMCSGNAKLENKIPCLRFSQFGTPRIARHSTILLAMESFNLRSNAIKFWRSSEAQLPEIHHHWSQVKKDHSN